MRAKKSYSVCGMSPASLVYSFSFYAYYVWFRKQERRDRSTNHASELYAWAVLSLNMTMLINIAISSIVLLSPTAMDAWRSIANLPKILIFGWSYPITLFLNYRVLLSTGLWNRICCQMETMPSAQRRLGFAIVAAASVSIFLGT